MITVRTQMYSTLSSALEGVCGVFYFYPKDNAQLPCVTYYEASNVRSEQADGREHLSEITYAIDIWAHSAQERDTIALLIDGALSEIGFARTFAHDVHEETLQHTAMKYRALVSADFMVSQ